MPSRKSYLNRLPLAVRVPLWKLFKSGATLVNDITGDVTGNLTGDVTGDITGDVTGNLAGTMTVVDSTDATSWIALFDSATGDLAIKTDAGLTYNSVTGEITATLIVGPVTGDLTGDVKADDTANIVTSGANVAASSLAAGTAAITTTTGDLIGDVQAVDTAAIVSSGADLANSIVSAGNVNITQELDITKAFSVTTNDIGIDLNFTATGATTGGVNSVAFQLDYDITSTPAGVFYPIGILNNMTSTHVGTLTQMEASLMNVTHNGAGTVTNVFAQRSWIDRNTGAGTITTGTAYEAYMNRTAGTFGTAYGFKSNSYGVIGTVYHLYAESDGNETLSYGVYTTGVDNDYLGGTLVSMPTGNLDVGGLNSLGTKGLIQVWGQGTASTLGGEVRIWNPEDSIASPQYYSVRVLGDVLHINGNVEPLQGIIMSQNDVNMTGVVALGRNTGDFPANEAYGQLTCYGNATGQTQGGSVHLNPAIDHDTTILEYVIDVTSDDFQIGPSTDPNSLIHHGGTGIWEFTGAGGVTMSGVGGLIITGPTSDAIQITTTPGDGVAYVIDLQASPAGTLTDDHAHTGVNVNMTSTINVNGNSYTLIGMDIDMNGTGITGTPVGVIGINIDTDASTTHAIYADGVTAHAYFGGEITAGVGVLTYPAVHTVDEDYNGDTISRIIDTAAAVFGEGLYLAADGNYEHSDADAAATMPVTAIACEPYEAATAKVLMIRGMICETAWTWSAPGVILYASGTAGAFTETAPSGSGDQVQIIGYALSADTIWFDPELTMVEIA